MLHGQSPSVLQQMCCQMSSRHQVERQHVLICCFFVYMKAVPGMISGSCRIWPSDESTFIIVNFLPLKCLPPGPLVEESLAIPKHLEFSTATFFHSMPEQAQRHQSMIQFGSSLSIFLNFKSMHNQPKNSKSPGCKAHINEAALQGLLTCPTNPRQDPHHSSVWRTARGRCRLPAALHPTLC